MQILDGKALSAELRGKLKASVEKMKASHGLAPGLAVILAGENPASRVYVGRKIKACAELGFHSVLREFPAAAEAGSLKRQIREWNEAPEIHGILIQLPLPAPIRPEDVFSALKPEKDPDGLTLENRALLWTGSPRVIPCTPKGIVALLRRYGAPIEGQRAVVVGRSQIVGLPMAQQLLSLNATVTICHSRTKNLREAVRQGDIVIVCAGRKRLLGREDFKKGAVVVDVGIHRAGSGGKVRLEGDVRPEGLDSHLSAFSPVPGGAGPMTIAMLLENTFHLARLSLPRKNGRAAENPA